MSLRMKRSSRSGRPLSRSTSLETFSFSKSSSTELVTQVVVNQSLLTPLNIEIDPTVQARRTQETEEIKGLNNHFVSFIDKVRLLEQENKLLETKWSLLQQKSATPSDVEPFFRSHIANLQQQLDQINNDKRGLEGERQTWLRKLEDYQKKFDVETNKRIESENNFVLQNKELDVQKLGMLNLELMLSRLNEDLTLFKTIYEAELQELQKSIKETSVVVEMDNSRDLNMDQIVFNIRAQYEEVTARSKEETEIWYKRKFDQMAAQANQHGSDVNTTKEEMARLKRTISRLENEIAATRDQCAAIEENNTEMDERGHQAILNAISHIKDLEEALKQAKQNMAKQIRDYQDLMNLKMTLEIEISTYMKLLEGEEYRMKDLRNNPVMIFQAAPPRDSEPQQKKPTPVILKVVETNNRSYN